MQVQSLGREHPLEKEMAIHSSILAQRISWTEKPGKLQSIGAQRVDMIEVIQYVVYSICACVCAKSLQLCLTVTLWAVACWTPLPMGFSRQEYWSELPCPPPNDILNAGIESMSPAALALQVILYSCTTREVGIVYSKQYTCWYYYFYSSVVFSTIVFRSSVQM